MKPEPSASTSGQQFLSGTLKQIDVGSLQHQLKELWHSDMSDDKEENRPAVTRACVLNLILYTSEYGAEVSLTPLLDEITGKYPCRVLLAIARPSESLSLEAWVSSRCRLLPSGGGKQICCEQITFRWEGNGVQELPSVVLPLLVPDLPAFLWWRTEDFNYAVAKPFLSDTDRLVVDSDLWLTGFKAFKELASCVDGADSQLVVSDLAWRRLLPWRKALASAFDELFKEFEIEDLNAIDSLELSATADSLSQAALMLGWLGSRLGWQPKSADTKDASTLLYRFGNGENLVQAVCKKLPAAGAEAGLKELSLKLRDNRRLTVKSRNQERAPALVLTASQGQAKAEATVKLDSHSEAQLLNQELEVLQRDVVFEEALAMVSRICV